MQVWYEKLTKDNLKSGERARGSPYAGVFTLNERDGELWNITLASGAKATIKESALLRDRFRLVYGFESAQLAAEMDAAQPEALQVDKKDLHKIAMQAIEKGLKAADAARKAKKKMKTKTKTNAKSDSTDATKSLLEAMDELTASGEFVVPPKNLVRKYTAEEAKKFILTSGLLIPKPVKRVALFANTPESDVERLKSFVTKAPGHTLSSLTAAVISHGVKLLESGTFVIPEPPVSAVKHHPATASAKKKTYVRTKAKTVKAKLMSPEAFWAAQTDRKDINVVKFLNEFIAATGITFSKHTMGRHLRKHGARSVAYGNWEMPGAAVIAAAAEPVVSAQAAE